MNEILNENTTAEEQMVAEAMSQTNAEETTVATEAQTIKFSGGVEFTPEELEQLDPALQAKLQELKKADVIFARGINEKSAKIKELESMINAAPAKTTQAAPAATAKAGNVDSVRQWQLSKMTEEKFGQAMNGAKAKYGEAVVNMINAKLGQLFSNLIKDGKFDTDFNALYTSAFGTLIAEDIEIVKAFNEFKGMGNLEAEAAKKAAAQAKIDVIQSKTSTTTGLPSGGNAVLNKTKEEPKKPTGMAQARELAKQRLAEIFDEE